MRLLSIPLALFTLLVSGCAVHSPMRMTSMTSVSKQAEKTFPPRTGKVFMTKGVLPASAKFESIAQIDTGKVSYGDTDVVFIDMANKARELGADAVIQVVSWYQVAAWAWAAPHGKGHAIKILDKDSVDFSTMVGAWY